MKVDLLAHHRRLTHNFGTRHLQGDSGSPHNNKDSDDDDLSISCK